jgi:hypothetical protein
MIQVMLNRLCPQKDQYEFQYRKAG